MPLSAIRVPLSATRVPSECPLSPIVSAIVSTVLRLSAAECDWLRFVGALVGGLPDAKLITAVGQASSSNLAPLHALLLREPEAVCCDALRQFTRQLLTSAESEGSVERHSLTVDLAKLSAEELNLAFRRACLKHHPHREYR